MEVTTFYPGSIGELVQGNFKGIDVLVSCPVNIFTRVRLFECKCPTLKFEHTKSMKFLNNVLRKWNCEKYINNLDIDINSDIPHGKGFASSTADICAVYYGLLKLFERKFDEDELIHESVRIEPTDSIIFKGLTVFDYKNGKFKECIGAYPELNVVVFEGTRTVDTVEFNSRNLPPLSPVDDLVEKIKYSVKDCSIKGMAEASEESILKNELRLKYDIMPEVLKVKEQTGGLGIIGAHSGNMLAVVYDDEKGAEHALKYIKSFYGCKFYGYKVYIVHTLDRIPI